MAVQDAVGYQPGDLLDDAVAKGAAVIAHRVALRVGQFQGYGQPHDAGDVLRAGTPLPLLAAAGDERQEGDATPDEQHADAFGSVEFMPGQAHHIDAQATNVEVKKTGGLYRVGVHHDGSVEILRLLPDGGRDFRDGIDGADLVVGVHHRYHGGAVGDGVVHPVRLDHTVVIDREIGDLPATVFELLAGVEDGMVLGGGGDDVPTRFFQGICRAANGRVVGLGPAAGENHLAVTAVEDASDALTGRVQGVTGFLPDGVDAGSVAVQPSEIGQHRLQDALVHGRGAGVVKVDVVLGGHGWVRPL